MQDEIIVRRDSFIVLDVTAPELTGNEKSYQEALREYEQHIQDYPKHIVWLLADAPDGHPIDGIDIRMWDGCGTEYEYIKESNLIEQG